LLFQRSGHTSYGEFYVKSWMMLFSQL